eukprot:2925964-Prymnesium_polylepis.1
MPAAWTPRPAAADLAAGNRAALEPRRSRALWCFELPPSPRRRRRAARLRHRPRPTTAGRAAERRADEACAGAKGCKSNNASRQCARRRSG